MKRPTRNVVVLGSTGSIGTQTLDVIERLQAVGWSFRVVGLAAGANVDLLENQVTRVGPDVVSVAGEAHADRLRKRFPSLHVLHGDEGPAKLAAWGGVDLVVNALVGAAGLLPTLEAVARDRTVALANKETLVIGGELVRDALRGGRLLPIDSEHSALLQCLEAGRREDVRRLILTASGGPFLDVDASDLAAVTPKDALRHPTWTMGARITIDSATMVNKAFEVIEAHYLFDIPYDHVDVVIHPPSIVHSMVEYRDGSVLAQMASHDMRIPIQYALTFPDRVATELPRLDLLAEPSLDFRPLDTARFPAFDTVLAAARIGGTAPAAVNAADEVLVKRFLRGDLSYPRIAEGLSLILERWRNERDDRRDEVRNVEELLVVDHWARDAAQVLFADAPTQRGGGARNKET